MGVRIGILCSSNVLKFQILITLGSSRFMCRLSVRGGWGKSGTFLYIVWYFQHFQSYNANFLHHYSTTRIFVKKHRILYWAAQIFCKNWTLSIKKYATLAPQVGARVASHSDNTGQEWHATLAPIWGQEWHPVQQRNHRVRPTKLGLQSFCA